MADYRHWKTSKLIAERDAMVKLSSTSKLGYQKKNYAEDVGAIDTILGKRRKHKR